MKFSTLAFILSMFILFGSCSVKSNSMNREISPSDKTIIDLNTKIYSETELLEITKFNGSIDDLNKVYPIECLRRINCGYRISYLGEKKIAVIIFNDSDIMTSKCYDVHLSKSDFYGIETGKMLTDVQSMDPKGEYLFLYTGRNDTPKISTHYTTDGYLITITYNNSNEIVSIKEELI